jgi:hypothetical protein
MNRRDKQALDSGTAPDREMQIEILLKVDGGLMSPKKG